MYQFHVPFTKQITDNRANLRLSSLMEASTLLTLQPLSGGQVAIHGDLRRGGCDVGEGQRDRLLAVGSYRRRLMQGFRHGWLLRSGAGYGTVTAAAYEGVPTRVLTAALCEGVSCWGADFADRVLSAVCKECGGREEKAGRS